MLPSVSAGISNWVGHIAGGVAKMQSDPRKFGHAAGLVVRAAMIWAHIKGVPNIPLKPLSQVIEKFGNLKDVVQAFSAPVDFFLNLSLDSSNALLMAGRNLGLVVAGATGTVMWLANLGFKNPGIIAASMGREVHVFGKIVALSAAKVLYGGLLIASLCEGIRHVCIIAHSENQVERNTSYLKAFQCVAEIFAGMLLVSAISSSAGITVIAFEAIAFSLSMAELVYSNSTGLPSIAPAV